MDDGSEPPRPPLDIQALLSLANQSGSLDLNQFLAASGIVQEGSREKERISERLGDFNAKDSPVWQEITRRFGKNLKQPDLLSMESVLAGNANIKLDRDAKRRKAVLLKWFDENWAVIEPYLDYVVFEDTRRD
jgi:hypothetical protein